MTQIRRVFGVIELYQMSISVVVLTHNDEASFPKCIASLMWCDEVVVIDDESTDGTAGLAKKLGAKVFVRKLNDDFAIQRNFGLAKAKGEWVLFVDSDEIVSKELATEIKEIASPLRLRSGRAERTRNDKVKGYYIKRKDWLFGRWLRHGETGKVKLLRLGKKNAGKWVQPVHEEWNINGNVDELANPLLHYPHQNVAQFLDQINRYSTLYANYLHRRSVREPVWQIVGKPATKFLLNYVIRLGFLDGTAGIITALMMSFHSFLVRAKLWQNTL